MSLITANQRRLLLLNGIAAERDPQLRAPGDGDPIPIDDDQSFRSMTTTSHEEIRVKRSRHGDIGAFPCSRHPWSEPDCIIPARYPSLYNLTSGRRSGRLHQYPASGGQGAQEGETILFLGC